MAANPAFLILFGIVVGVFSGLMGLGGGSVMIPIMVLLLGMTQQQAHGTSLAVMIPPVTLPAPPRGPGRATSPAAAPTRSVRPSAC